MNNFKKIFTLSLLTVCFSGFQVSTHAATVIEEGGNGPVTCAVSYPCKQVFKVGDVGNFRDINPPYALRTFRVDAVDAAGNRIWSNRLGAWLPAGPLRETDSHAQTSGDQILRVGERFTIHGGDIHDGEMFLIHAIDIPTDSVKIKIGTQYVWVYAEPMFKFCRK